MVVCVWPATFFHCEHLLSLRRPHITPPQPPLLLTLSRAHHAHTQTPHPIKRVVVSKKGKKERLSEKLGFKRKREERGVKSHI